MADVRMRRIAAGILLIGLTAGGSGWSQGQEESPDQLLSRAVELQEAGDLEGAIQKFEALLSLYPEAEAVHFNLGSAYLQAGQAEQAIGHFQQAIQSGRLPDPTGARVVLGWAYFQASRFQDACDLLAEVVREEPGNRQALQVLASSHLRLGDWQKAVSLLSPLEPEMDEAPELAYVLGAALVEGGQVARGAQLVEKGLAVRDSGEARFRLGQALVEQGDYFGALHHLERALELNPKIPTLYSTYGRLLRTLTRIDEADQAFLKELAFNPGDYDANLFHGTYLYENEQKYDEALACFKRALKTRPGDGAVRFQIGLVYNYANRIEEALEVIEGVVEEFPDFLDGQVTITGLYYRLGREEEAERHRAIAERLRASRDGQHLIQQGQFAQAVELFERQKKADPSNPEPYFYKGMALSQAQDWPGAVTEFQEAVRLDPANPKYVISHANALARSGAHEKVEAALHTLGPEQRRDLDPRLAWLLGDTYYQIGERDQALAVFDLLAEADPEDARVDLMRGQIHLFKGDFGRARTLAESSIEKQPENNSAAYSLLATALYQLGEKPEARTAFQKALDQDPTNPDHLRRLGALSLEMGDQEAAIRYLERARSVSDDNPDTSRLLEMAHQARQEALRGPVKPESTGSGDSGDSTADDLFERGKRALVAGQVRDAVRWFEQEVGERPDNWNARSVLADLYLAQGALAKAHTHLAQMERIDPESLTGQHLMAQYWYQRGDYERSLEYALAVKQGNPSSADLRNLLGNLYFSLGRTEQAVGEYAAAVELDPDRSEFQMNLEAARRKLP